MFWEKMLQYGHDKNVMLSKVSEKVEIIQSRIKFVKILYLRRSTAFHGS